MAANFFTGRKLMILTIIVAFARFIVYSFAIFCLIALIFTACVFMTM